MNIEKIFSNMEVKATKEDRVVEFIATKEVVDRDGDIVKVSGLNVKNYKKNPVILLNHDRRGLPVGKAVRVVKSGGELKVKIKFADPEEYSVADTVYKLVKGGYINAVSMGLMPDWETMEYKEDKKTKKRIRTINKADILEISIVTVPANQEALVTGKSLQKALEDKVIDELELKELEMSVKEIKDEEIEEPSIKDAENTIIELKSKVAELELQLKEQEMESEVEDDIYKEIFDHLTGKQGTETDDHTASTLDKDLDINNINKLFEENNDD